MSRGESMRQPIRHCAGVLLFMTLVVGVTNISSAQLTRVSGQPVSGGGKSAAADRVVVGAVVLGPSGVSSAGGTRIASGPIHYGRALTATYTGSAVQVVSVANRTLKVAVVGGTGQITGRYFDRLGGQSGYTQNAMTRIAGDTMIFELQGSRLGLRGLEYYFEIELAQAIISIGTADLPFSFITVLQNVAAGALPAQQYRMIGFPFDVSPSTPAAVFEDDLGTADPVEWRIGRYDAQAESYDEYPSFGNIAAGRGYWIITRDGATVDASGQSAAPDTSIVDGVTTTRYGRLVVEPGWNQIATPFGFQIDWSDRVAESGIESVLWEYTSGFDEVTSYDPAASLEPFVGYWLFNSSASSRRLLLPYTESASPGIARRASEYDGSDWSIHLAVTAGKVADRNNIAGTAPTAETGPDASDFSEPPVIGNYISLAFTPEPLVGNARLLAGDFRPRGQGLYAFDLLLRGNVTDPIRLTSSIEGQFGAGMRVALIDSTGNRVYDLLESPEIVLPQIATEKGARFKLLVGDENNPEFPDPTATTLPRAFTLAQNYPNPFNSSTRIGFDVSSASAVRITITNVLGQAVRVLTDREYEPGRYSLPWDGRDDNGTSLGSGIYLYQLVTGDVRITRKMVLLK